MASLSSPKKHISNNGEPLGTALVCNLLGAKEFLCLVEKKGSEQECFSPPKLGTLLIKPISFHTIFVVCVYMAATDWTPTCLVTLLLIGA